MISINNKQYRNLEEQVGFLTAAYDANRVVAEFGINVMGTYVSYEALPQDYNGNYGDAYAVGAEPPYQFYVWTRANTAVGEFEPYWFNIGELAIVGPAGPEGPEGKAGPQGVRGSLWFSGTGKPNIDPKYNVGDYYINSLNGNYWHLHKVNGLQTWLQEGNLTGPIGATGQTGPRGFQGERGPIGKTGPVGPVSPIVNIVGSITSITELPQPSTVPANTAYIQLIDGEYYLHIIVGGAWTMVGRVANGSVIYENGAIIGTFNADSKLNITDEPRAIYATDENGEQTLLTYNYGANAYQIAQRDGNGQLSVPYNPADLDHATSKLYVDNAIHEPNEVVLNKVIIGEGLTTDIAIAGGTTNKQFVSEVAQDLFGDNPLVDTILNSPLFQLHESQANAPMSISLGADNEANASGSIALGYDNINGGWCSTAVGALNQVNGSAGLAYGYNNKLNGDFGVVFGQENEAGNSALAGGILSKATGKGSIAFGNECEANADYSIALGGDCIVEEGAIRSAAIGNNCNITGRYSVAFGNQAKALANEAFACNYKTEARGAESFACGSNTKAIGPTSFVAGYNNEARGENSFAAGEGLKTTIKNQIVLGQFNAQDDDAILIVGNGTSKDNLSNALVVKKNGDLHVLGIKIN